MIDEIKRKKEASWAIYIVGYHIELFGEYFRNLGTIYMSCN